MAIMTKSNNKGAAKCQTTDLDPDYPELVSELMDLFGRTLKACKGDCDEQSERLVIALCSDFGGLQVYIPSLKAIEIGRRDRLIFRKYQRGNARKLAEEFGLTESRIYHIVKSQREGVKP